MSDQAEAPPKKIGSLRDRIAAFEKAGAGSAGPAPAPPPPRPKPAGFSSWKPRPPSPTSGEPSQAAAPAKPSAGLSTADAKESITKGQSLKERMAALQGKGGFGAPPPVAPKPALEKPKWKPPPAIAAPKDDDDGDDQPRKPLDLEGIVKSPPAEHSGEKVAGEGEAKESSSAEGEEATEVDPEEEERQRRAAIAARMARLGGARVGMAPPTVFGKRPPPPPKKRSSVSEDAVLSDTPKEAVTSPKLQATEPETVPIETVPNVPSPPSESTAGTPPSSQSTPARRPSEAGSLASIESSESHHSSRSPPVSMPVPATPRRAAPPRKKPVKPTAPPPPVPEVEGEQQEETSTPTAEPVTEAVLPKAALATALPTSLTPAETAGTVPVSSNEVLETATNEPPAAFLPPEVTENTDNRLATPEAAKPQSIVEEPETNAEDEKEYEVENEVELDEETKRRQVAERVARMGGVNPFSASVLPRRQSSNTSEASVQPPPTVEKESEQPASPPAVSQSRRSSKLSEPPLSPLHPAAQEKRLSRGSVDSSRAEVGAQGPTVGEPSEIEEEEESAMDEGLLVLKQTKVLDQSPAVTKRETPQQTRTLVKEDSAEDDGDSEYSNDDEDHKPSVDTLPTPLSVPHHPVHRSPEAPHRSAPPPPPPALFEDEDEDEDAALQEANEDMIRSQILIPPTKEAHDEDTPLTPRKEGTDQSAYPEEGGVAYDDTGSEYEEEEEEEILPSTQPPVRDAAPSFMPPPPPPGRPNLPARSPPPPANRGLPPAPPTIVHTTSQDSLKVPAPVEVLDDDEGDPIDPSFHSPSRRTSQVLPSTSVTPPEDTTAVADAPAPQEQQGPPESQEDAEAVRRRTIAERMAKLGGIKFGAAPPAPGAPKRPPPPPQREEEDGEAHEAEGSQGQPEEDEEAEERARKERIATKLAGMGGMRIGMMPSAFPPRKSHVLTEEPAAPALPSRGPPARALPPPQAHESESEVEGSTTSEDAVKVEVDESDLEEVLYEDVEEEPAPPIPSRASRPIRRESAEAPPLASSPPTRPPVPSGLPPRRPSIKSVSSQRRVSGESTMSPPPSQRRPSAPKSHPSEYVMVEEPQNYEEETPPLPPNRPAGRRTSGPPTRSPPPPLPEDSLSSQWELPAIPTSNLDLGSNDLEMSWTEAEAPREVDSVVPPAPSIRRQSGVQYPPQPPPIHGASTQSPVSSSDLHLSADDLMALWGRVGVQVCEAATILFERSKKGLVGDGTYPGFIHAVIREVPNALPTADYGYLIYKQNGASVQKRASDIMPGDLVELHDAKLKGHKGLQAYHQTVGADEPVVGVIGEFDAKKSKIKVFQANQHVGQQTVESVSYRLEDLKSGVVKVYRVLEAQ